MAIALGNGWLVHSSDVRRHARAADRLVHAALRLGAAPARRGRALAFTNPPRRAGNGRGERVPRRMQRFRKSSLWTTRKRLSSLSGQALRPALRPTSEPRKSATQEVDGRQVEPVAAPLRIPPPLPYQRRSTPALQRDVPVLSARRAPSFVSAVSSASISTGRVRRGSMTSST